MTVDFWQEEYFLHPDFEDLYTYAEVHPDRVYVFYPVAEAEYGDELFYQLCVSGDYPHSQYAQSEKELGEIFAELRTKERIVAFASSRTMYSKQACKLTGLDRSQLQQLRKFCDKRQCLTSQEEMERFLLCVTRGLASACAFALDGKILLLMQDLHGCIIWNEDSDKAGLKQIIKTFQGHKFVVQAEG